MEEIIITENEIKNKSISLLKNKKLIETYNEFSNISLLEGNIYCGIVKNIFPSMQIAFVDIGEEKNAFIHIKDILPKVSNTTGNKKELFINYKINEYLNPNMPILVQIKKDEEAKKGARVSKHISLVGKFCVIFPEINFITVSRKIEDENKIKQLKQISKEILNNISSDENYGIVLRTSSQNITKEDLEKDILSLINKWKKIKKDYNKIKNNNFPALIYKNNDIIKNFLIGVMNNNIENILVNTTSLYNKVKNILQEINNSKINLILKDTDYLEEIYNLKHQLDKISERKIWLKCGGFITIDKTEALTAIDINSGKFTGKKNSTLNDTIYIVNNEATIEIAKQLRLRNINGIIVIDYIDMENNDDRIKILDTLQDELKKDRSKTQVIGFTKLDLLEMTRKKL